MVVLNVMQRGEPWDVLAYLYKLKPATFEKMIMKYINVISEYLYEYFVEAISNNKTIRELQVNETKLDFHPCALYATDACFQETNRPSGNHRESKGYFLKKHNLYGVKQEVTVAPNSMCIHSSNWYMGSAVDIQIMRQNVEIHWLLTKMI